MHAGPDRRRCWRQEGALAIDDGFRESEQSWHELLVRLRDQNGLVLDPELATGDGALGFWKAARKVWPNVKQQRCWVHKTANVLNYLPKSVQTKAKTDLHAIYEAASRADAEAAFDRFLAKYQAKYDKAAGCLAKDREALLAFYDFPAEHWKHVRSTDEIDKSFVSVSVSLPWLGGYGASAARRAPPSTRIARRASPAGLRALAARSGDGGGATLAVRFGLPSPDEVLVGAFGLLRDRQLLMT